MRLLCLSATAALVLCASGADSRGGQPDSGPQISAAPQTISSQLDGDSGAGRSPLQRRQREAPNALGAVATLAGAAVDVFPVEPVPANDPVRSLPNVILSAHRTGGTTDALFAIGSMAVADAELIMRGLPPQLCRRADPAVASRLRSKPVDIT